MCFIIRILLNFYFLVNSFGIFIFDLIPECLLNLTTKKHHYSCIINEVIKYDTCRWFWFYPTVLFSTFVFPFIPHLLFVWYFNKVCILNSSLPTNTELIEEFSFYLPICLQIFDQSEFLLKVICLMFRLIFVLRCIFNNSYFFIRCVSLLLMLIGIF